MKKFLPTIIISSFVLIFLIAPFAVKAQTPNVNPGSYGTQNTPKFDEKGQAAPPPGVAGDIVEVAQAGGGALFNLVGLVLSPLAKLILETMGYITYLTGVILNASVFYTIIQMSEKIGTLPAIDVTWKVVRDLANMGFIFMLLSASIMTIMGKEKGARELVVKMVIAAILVNFSLFFTKVIIDVANLLALTFYNAIAPNLAPGDYLSGGLSNSIVQVLKAQSLWDVRSILNGGTVFISVILSSVALLVTSFVFLAISVMLVVRYVVLIFVMILSPLMFMAMVFPQLNSYASRWSDALFGQAFFAPVYFLLTWITLVLIKGLNESVFVGAGPLAEGLASGGDTISAIPALINYAVIIIFLVATLIISKGVADKAGKEAKGLNKWAMGMAGGAALGSAGAIGRTTLGRAGQVIADSERLKKAAPTSRLARLALATGQKGAGASYDARSSKAFNNLSGTTGVSFGKGSGDKGYAKIVKDEVEKQKKIADSFKPSDFVVVEAEANLKKAKDSGDIEARVTAQKDVDKFKGLSKKDAEKRQGEISKEIDAEIDKNSYVVDEKKITDEIAAKNKELIETKDVGRRMEINDEINAMGITLSSAKEKADQARSAIKSKYQDLINGAKEITSAGNQRKEDYAKSLENPNKVIFVSRSNKEASLAIRKSIKEKSKEQNLAESIKALTEDKKDDKASSNSPSSPASGPTTPPTA